MEMLDTMELPETLEYYSQPLSDRRLCKPRKATPRAKLSVVHPKKKTWWVRSHPKVDGCWTTLGNSKLGKDTLIINFGPGKDCPSRRLGLCKVCNAGIECYNTKAEKAYPQVIPFRLHQQEYFRTTSAENIAAALSFTFEKLNSSKRVKLKVKYCRFSESSDFEDQLAVYKFDQVCRLVNADRKSKGLKPIVFYGYTARADLDFSGVSFIVRGSGYDIKGAAGKTCVIRHGEQVPKGFKLCPADCKACNLCKISKGNIAFLEH